MHELLTFNARAASIAAHFGATLNTADATVVFSTLRFYCTYLLPGDDEPLATEEATMPEQALANFRNTLAARTDNRPNGLFSCN